MSVEFHWFNFYDGWELFWPQDVTWGELHRAANQPNEGRS
jgi:hypothetical protein